MQKIRKGDTVFVLSGREHGRSGVVIQVNNKAKTALVGGLNMMKRHQRQTQNREGGIISKEAPIHLSNLAISDPKDGKPTRVSFRIEEDGKKVRIARRSGELIDG
ncbi:MAG: large subunit ribosomal protein L24 [Candidatus Tokpelaia sp. JSC161]|jgi:large subunit ribosomal protein L24|nr:MAG: large subunit ribosomal protein L24 [Candidatus Tokpelaia sp. JSC161]